MKTLEIDNAYQLAASIGATDHLIEQATKEPLGEAIRVLAIAVGCDRTRLGEMPDSEMLDILRTEHLDDQTMTIVIAGMQSLVLAGSGGRVMDTFTSLSDFATAARLSTD